MKVRGGGVRGEDCGYRDPGTTLHLRNSFRCLWHLGIRASFVKNDMKRWVRRITFGLVASIRLSLGFATSG